MRILFFSHYFPPEGNAPASRTYENCKRWVRDGHHVTVITCVPNHPDGVVYKGYKNLPWQRENIDGIDVVRVGTYIAANKRMLRRIANFLSYMVSASFFSMFVKKPDVVIATSPQFFCGWAGVIASRLHRVPFILEIRDIWPESIVAVGALRNKRLLRLVEWFETKLYGTPKHIVTVGDGYRQRLMEKGVAPDRITVIMNGVDSGLFYPREADEGIRAQYGLQGKFVCSYIGTIGMACGLDVVLRAAQALKKQADSNVVFLLVGDGANLEQLRNQARDLELDNVIFTGRQPRSTVPGFMSVTSACLIHLKKTELFTTVMPSKIFEAAGMACPMIIGVSGFANELVQKAGAGVSMEPENETQLLEAVQKLSSNPELCRSLGQAGYAYFVKHYNRETLAELYIRTIAATLAPDARPSGAISNRVDV